MRSFITLVGALGLGTLCVQACSDDDLLIGPGGSGGSTDTADAGGGSAGSAASGGAAGRAGAGGSAGRAGAGGAPAAGAGGGDAGSDSDAGTVSSDAGDAGPPTTCSVTPDCDDQNACTTEVCANQLCVFTPVAIGTACGDTATDNECTQPDTCDANGVCLANHQPDGTLCTDGHCNSEGACDCALDRVTTVPYNQQWQTTDENEPDVVDAPGCQICANTRDHLVVFTAQVAGTYRFTVTSEGDPELAVYDGDCTGDLDDFTCGDDIDEENEDYADQLELELAAGTTVTVVAGESCEENGGAGILSIELVP